MKRISAFWLVLILLCSVGVHAQRLDEASIFSTDVDSTKWITLDTSAQNLINTNGTRSSLTSIGFPFTYAGVQQTHFSFTKYGYLRFGNSLANYSYRQYPLGNHVSSFVPGVIVLTGYQSVQIDSASHVRYQTVGDTGSRVLVVEMQAKITEDLTYDTGYVRVQLQLHEASNAIRIVYGTPLVLSPDDDYQIGFVASTTDVALIDVVNSQLVYATTTNQRNASGARPERWRWYELEYDSNYCYHYTTPWGEDFNSNRYTNCWSVLDFDSNPYSEWFRSGNVMEADLSSGNCNNWLVTPLVQLPTTDDGLRLTYDYLSYENSSRMQVRMALYYSDDDPTTIDTSDFTTLLRTEDQSTDFAFIPRGISLAPYAGMQVRIAFVANHSDNNYYIQLDNVQIALTTTPSILIDAPEKAFAHDTTLIDATLIAGAETGLTYSWHSTMADDSMATFTTNDNHLSIVYTHWGTDTLTCIASNSYGSDTNTQVIDVRDCTTVTEFPWMEDFEHGLDCWYQLGGWSASGSHGSYEGNYALISNNGSSGGSFWIISQPIAVPDTHVMALPELIWRMRTPSTDAYTNNHFSVLIATSSDSTVPALSAFDTVFSIPLFYGPWQRYHVSLAPYAGQTIRIMFHNHPSHSGWFIYDNVLVDQVEVRSTAVPMIEIDDPLCIEHLDSVTITAHLIEGDTNGLTYRWHSVMVDSSMATSIANDTLLNITYSYEGTDIITLIAANAYGSDTATITVSVHDCPAHGIPYFDDFGNAATRDCWSGFTSDNFSESRLSYGTPWLLQYDSNGYYMVSNSHPYTGVSLVEWLVSPAIDIPSNPGDLYLSWHHSGSIYVRVARGEGYHEPGDFDTTIYTPADGPAGTQSISMAPFAGQRIHLGFLSAYTSTTRLDSVRVAYHGTAPIASLSAPDTVFMPNRLTVTATLNECTTHSLTQTWHSTMEAAGLATVSISNNQLTVIYSAGGSDTITYIVSNLIGADTQQVVVWVDDCSGRTIPYTENFDGVDGAPFYASGWLPGCWGSLWNGHAMYVPHVLQTGQSPFLSYDSKALIMMAGQMSNFDTVAYAMLPPLGQPLYNLSIAFSHQHENALYGTLTVGYFADFAFVPVATMPVQADSMRRDTVSLVNLPDSATTLAFMWHCHTVWYSVLIDDVEVFMAPAEGRPPRAVLTAPDSATTETPILCSAQLQPCDTTGLTFAWHSTMAAAGYATLSANDTHCYITYTAPGTDTVTFIVTNAFGVDTQQAVVQVLQTIHYYQVSALSGDSTMGSVSGSGTYQEGDTATLTAIPNEDYHFTHWNDGDTANPRQILVTSDTSFTAYFAVDSLPPTPPDTIWRTVSVLCDNTMGSVSGSGTYQEGDTATLTATPNEGYHFTHWSDSSTVNPRQILVLSDTTLTAYFEADTTQSITDPLAESFALYPNPASTTVTIESDRRATLTLLDVSGRERARWTIQSGKTPIDIRHLPSGPYFLRLEGTPTVKRLIIK